jgi:Protein of unknown function (DUF3592)
MGMSHTQGKSRQRGATLNLKVLLFLALLLFATFLFLWWLVVFPVAPAWLFGVHTQGIVQNVSACTAQYASGQVTPTVQFTDRRGRRYLVTDDICGEYAVGEPVTVSYVPSNPQVAILEDDTVSLVVLSLLTGLFGLATLVLVGCFLFRRMAGSRGTSESGATGASSPQMGLADERPRR